LLLFWLIWWAWTQFTWTLNPADTNHDVVRVITLLATGAAFLMAASTTRAFGDDVLWFVVPYLVVRILGLALQVRIDLERDSSRHRAMYAWVAMSVIGLALVFLGAFVDPPARNWIWLLAIAADLTAAARASRGQWDLTPAHFSERHGLFVIIALGESLIVAAAAVSAEPRTADLVADTVAALAVAGLLWWTYFGWLKEALEAGLEAAGRNIGAIASTAFSIGHFPVVCGIVAFAVALEEIVRHPAHVPPTHVTAALGVGVALFVGCSALAYWRTCGVLLASRLVLLLVTVGALAAVSSLTPAWQLGVVALGLLAIVLVEGAGPSGVGDEPAEGDLPLAEA
jgi:low temperature requirement protein LtrA